MELYLVQHGEAKPESEDPSRPLTDKGRHETEVVASLAARLGLRLNRIFHSGKLRARQTAEIMAEHLKPSGGVSEASGLAPLDSPEKAKELIEAEGGAVMICGHLPHLSRLVALLTVGDPEKTVVKFRYSAIVALTREENKWAVSWMLTPEQAKQLL